MKRIIILLMAVIASVETIIMLLMPALLVEWVDPWVPAFCDAIVVSLVSIMALYWMNYRGWTNIRGNTSQRGVGMGFAALKTGAIVFTVEAILMFALELPSRLLNHWQALVLDVVALTGVATILIYWLVLEPVRSDDNYRMTPPTAFYMLLNGFFGYIGAVILLALVLLSAHDQQTKRHQAKLEGKESRELVLVKSAFLNRLQQASLDVLAISLATDLHEWIETGASHSLFELERDFLNQARIKPVFDQIRFIDRNGDEIIRINQEAGRPIVQTLNKLQNKRARYYFKNGMQLEKGQIYLSPFDLNIEYGQVEHPYKPIIRIATVIIDDAGEKAGIVVINLKGAMLLDDMEKASGIMTGRIALLNQQGYWLYGEAWEKLWGFMFADKQQQTFATEKPEVWNEIRHQQDGVVHSIEGTYVVDTIVFDTKPLPVIKAEDIDRQEIAQSFPNWKLISFIPDTLVEELLVKERNLLIFLFFLIAILGAAGVVMLLRAMLNRNIAEYELFRSAHYDKLTALANRSLFSENLKREMAHSRRTRQPLVLMYLDLDRFKPVNDELGHEAGDELLRQVAERLKACVRECDTLARLGGDEFAIILPQYYKAENKSLIAQRILDRIHQPFDIFGNRREIGISIGIAAFDGGEAESDLIRRADSAMYDAKQAGRSCYRYALVEGSDGLSVVSS